MSAADELAAAVTALREDPAGRETVLPSGAIISRVLAEPLARWIDSWTGIDFNERAAMPEDLRHALALARLINTGSQP
jgi:hypothetical protein